jgi:predicted RNA binding protein YcfA (HicA-like mRNA interferase family)
MSSQHPPLTCDQVKNILRYLGFSLFSQHSTSHEKWRKEGHAGYVTVDCPKQPFSHDLVRYMAIQAGTNKKKLLRYTQNYQ